MSTACSPEAKPAAGESWLDRLYALRDRFLTSESFRRRAADFPLTRPIARRRTRQLFDIVAGAVYSQILFACVELGLFDLLAEGPLDIATLSVRLKLSRDATTRLLEAAASLKLVSRRSKGRFGLGVLGTAMIGNPGIVAMVAHHRMLYADLRDPVALLRGRRETTELSRYWAYAPTNDLADLSWEQVGAYTSLMSASQSLIADAVLDAYPMDGHRCLLDVGGGDGSFLISAAARKPELRLVLFDLPPVAERARARFAEAGLAARALALGGDFRRDALPLGADLVSLVRVLHDHDDATVLTLLRAARQALSSGGTLLIAEPMADRPGSDPVTDAYFGFYLLAMGDGRIRTRRELTALLERAGFETVRPAPTSNPLLTRVLVARVNAA